MTKKGEFSWNSLEMKGRDATNVISYTLFFVKESNDHRTFYCEFVVKRKKETKKMAKR